MGLQWDSTIWWRHYTAQQFQEILTLHVRKLSLREVKNLAPSHKSCQWWSQDFNSACHTPFLCTQDPIQFTYSRSLLSHVSAYWLHQLPISVGSNKLQFIFITHTHIFSWPYHPLQLLPLFSALLDSKTPRKIYLYSLSPVSPISLSWTHPSQVCNPTNSTKIALVKSLLTFTLLSLVAKYQVSPSWHISNIWHPSFQNTVLPWLQDTLLSWFPFYLSGCSFSDGADSFSSPPTRSSQWGATAPPPSVYTQTLGNLI